MGPLANHYGEYNSEVIAKDVTHFGRMVVGAYLAGNIHKCEGDATSTNAKEMQEESLLETRVFYHTSGRHSRGGRIHERPTERCSMKEGEKM